HLGAVDDPVAAVLLRIRLHVGRVGAAVRLGQAEAADHLAAGHGRQPALALLLAAVGVDRIHAQRALHRDEAADAAVAALQLLADQAVADRVQAGAAVLL